MCGGGHPRIAGLEGGMVRGGGAVEKAGGGQTRANERAGGGTVAEVGDAGPAARPSFVVGFCVSDKKFRRLMRASFMELLAAHRIEARLLLPGVPIADQGPFSAVLHKVPRGSSFEQQLREFAAAYPAVPIIDPIEKIAQIQSRERMLSAVGQLRFRMGAAGPGPPGAPLRIPVQVFVEDASSMELVLRRLEESGVRPPLLVKPANPSQHEIYAVPDLQRLQELFERGELHRHAGGVLLQNFVDHGGTLHKIYVVGRRVVEDLRNSLPDVKNWGQLEAQWGKPLGRVSAYRRPSREESPAEASPLGPNLDGGLCTAIARALQAHLQLSLFNFDLIKDADGHMYVIDINYFPGLSKVPGYEQIFLEFLAESCTEPPD